MRGLVRGPAILWGLILLCVSSPAWATPVLIGQGSIPGTASDLSGDSSSLGDAEATPHNRLGGIGSGIAFTGTANRYVMVPDRGPADGRTTYQDRFQVFDITVNPALGTVAPSLVATRLMRNEAGGIFTGSSAAFDATNSPASLRFDPEGVRIGNTGTLFVSDEYGPSLYEFAQNGDRLRALDIPNKFLLGDNANIPQPNANGALELPPNNTMGRQANRGMEGLAISPDGSKLYGSMQSPLIQDGGLNASISRVGINDRILEIDVATGAAREFLYQLSAAGNGISEILAINDHEFLVLERDGRAGSSAAFKQLFKVDIISATDTSGIGTTAINGLPTSGTPAGIEPVMKSLYLDLLDPAFGLAGASFPEKIEGLTFGPDLDDGRHLLLVTSDNDFIAGQPTRFFAFALDDLPGFQQQQVVPEPTSVLLFGTGLLGSWVWRKRYTNRARRAWSPNGNG